MFVGKNELKNAWDLTKIRLFNGKTGWIYLFLSTGILMLTNLVPTLIALFRQTEGVASYSMVNHSSLFPLGGLIGIAIMTCFYRQTNDKYTVYPQSNTSRFLSVQMLYHIVFAAVAVLALLLYLIQYAVFALLARSYENIVLIYGFSLKFALCGFCVLLIYGLVFMAVITLLGALIRKFTLYAMLCFAVLLGFLFAKLEQVIPLFIRLFGFLLLEKSPLLFALKGLAVWALLWFLVLVINKYTIYYKSQNKASTVILSLLLVGAIVCGGILSALVADYDSVVEQGSSTEEYIDDEEGADDYWRLKKIVLDVSGIPVGTDIELVAENLLLADEVEAGYSAENEIRMSNMDIWVNRASEELKNFQGGEIQVFYFFPRNAQNGYSLTELAQPSVSAWLEGNALHVRYEYKKNVKAVFLSGWTFMWQFGEFKGKNLFKEFVGSSSESGGGGVNIYVKSSSTES